MALPARWPRILATVLFLVAPASLHSQGAQATGTLTAVWGDPPAPSSAPPDLPSAAPDLRGASDLPGAAPDLRWFLTDDRGRVVEVDIPPELVRRAGGVRAVDRRRVSVYGPATRRPGSRRIDPPLLRATALEAAGPAPGPSSSSPSSSDGSSSYARTGSQPFAVLLCAFSDRASDPRPRSFFETLMGDGYPNMGHYYREVSAGRMDLGGTRVFGWYALPHPHAHYVDGGTGTLSLPRLAADCVDAAGSAVDFSAFAGIIAQFNGQLTASGSGSAYGGSMALALDGSTRAWPFVWMPLWAMEPSRYGIYAHELGHALGLPHSSGPYDQTYDSMWDVMSNPYLRYDRGVEAWVPGQTIAFHKDLLGWIPPDRKVTLTHADALTLRLDPHSAQTVGGAPLVVEVRIPGTPDAYTVEARERTGYDAGLPGETVVIHRVPDPVGPDCSPHRCARVVDAHADDPDGNPNGAGAMWAPGETFDDAMGVRVSVTSATDTGWALELTVTPPARPGGLSVDRAARALLDELELTAGEVAYLDRMGNRNGRFDLGDFLALVRREEP